MPSCHPNLNSPPSNVKLKYRGQTDLYFLGEEVLTGCGKTRLSWCKGHSQQLSTQEHGATAVLRASPRTWLTTPVESTNRSCQVSGASDRGRRPVRCCNKTPALADERLNRPLIQEELLMFLRRVRNISSATSILTSGQTGRK